MRPKILKSIQELVTTSHKSACQVGHEDHETLVIDIELDGKPKTVPDVAGVPEYLKQKMVLEVFDHNQYSFPGQYCPGDGALPETLELQGVWESSETILFLDILHRGSKENLIIDYGSNIGWYTILGALQGYNVIAFDEDPDLMGLMIKNLDRNQCSDMVYPRLAKIDHFVPPFDSQSETIEVVKCDLEGYDKMAFEMCRDLFQDKKVNYALFEISPVFNNSYPELVESIVECGYKVYTIPDKGSEFLGEYEKDPLNTIIKRSEIPSKGRKAFINGLSQDNFLFVKQ